MTHVITHRKIKGGDAIPVYCINCGEDIDLTVNIVCDDNGTFYQVVSIDENGVVVITNLDFSGAPYVPVGTVAGCDDDLIVVALNPIHLIQSGAANDDRLTVTAVVTTTALVPEAATTHIRWRAEGSSGRLTTDGSAPVGGFDDTTYVGTIIKNGDSDIMPIEDWLVARWISNTGVDMIVHGNQAKPKV